MGKIADDTREGADDGSKDQVGRRRCAGGRRRGRGRGRGHRERRRGCGRAPHRLDHGEGLGRRARTHGRRDGGRDRGRRRGRSLRSRGSAVGGPRRRGGAGRAFQRGGPADGRRRLGRQRAERHRGQVIVDRAASPSSWRSTAIGVGTAAVLVCASCTDGGSASAAGSSGSAAASGGAGSDATISQPAIPTRIPVAAASERVDLTIPTFSNPTAITNPLFPVSDQASVLLLGHVDDKPFRTEVTLLPSTRVIEWEGQRVEPVVSQYNAFLGGPIEEVAYDLYAQADDGSVWYFGEDVFDFRDGSIISTEGTWQAGRDGPAAMIMPGDTQVGDVYRTENAPGFVFEEVTVRSTDQTLDGPLGPIMGGMLADELHSDGKTEQKVFAPGYGEFYTAGGGDVEALALAIPTDAATEPLPAELGGMSDGAFDVYDAAATGDWKAATRALDSVARGWAAYRAGEVPRLIGRG